MPCPAVGSGMEIYCVYLACDRRYLFAPVSLASSYLDLRLLESERCTTLDSQYLQQLFHTSCWLSARLFLKTFAHLHLFRFVTSLLHFLLYPNICFFCNSIF